MGLIKRIHVNQFAIRAKESHPLTVKTSKENTRASSVKILDSNGKVIAEVKYEPEHPLSCGAKVWIETRAEVIVT